MAVFRNPPRCPLCDKQIAFPVYKKPKPNQPTVYGDSFEGWEYVKEHECVKEVTLTEMINNLNNPTETNK